MTKDHLMLECFDVHLTVTAEEYAAYSEAAVERNMKQNKFKFYGAMGLLLAVFIAFMLYYASPVSYLFLVVVVPYMVYKMMTAVKDRKKKVRERTLKQYEISDTMKHPVTYTFCQDNFERTDMNAKTQLTWGEVHKVEKISCFYVIYTSNSSGYILPERALSYAETITFRSMVGDKLVEVAY